ncbi:MAG: HigA family addiction module antidote protein [Magnetococcales bacterium]|nr:HigA family addiction module antidote protein [Magnetococcales bacterium]
MITSAHRTRKTSHPGGIIRRLYMAPLGLKVIDLANGLQVSRKTVSKILNERGSIEPYMALRLAQFFNTTPELWINLQQNHSLAIARETDPCWRHIHPFTPRIETESTPSAPRE